MNPLIDYFDSKLYISSDVMNDTFFNLPPQRAPRRPHYHDIYPTPHPSETHLTNSTRALTPSFKKKATSNHARTAVAVAGLSLQCTYIRTRSTGLSCSGVMNLSIYIYIYCTWTRVNHTCLSQKKKKKKKQQNF